MLEVGCGLGNFMVEARDAGFDIYGIDVSESAAASANQTLGEKRACAGELEMPDLKPAPLTSWCWPTWSSTSGIRLRSSPTSGNS